MDYVSEYHRDFGPSVLESTEPVLNVYGADTLDLGSSLVSLGALKCDYC